MTAEYVLETLGAIHPGALVSVGTGREGSYVLVPSATRPALVLPAQARRQASAACVAYAAPRGAKARLRSALLSVLFRSGLGDRVFRDRILVGPSDEPSLGDRLGQLLGTDVKLAFPVGMARANRKPVVQALSSTGEVLAFAKVGIDRLTDGLVRHETHALTQLAELELGSVRIPRVVESASWQGHPMLVSEAMRAAGRRTPASKAAVLRGMGDVAGVAGVVSCEVNQMPWWARNTEVLEGLGESDLAARLRVVRDRLSQVAHARVVVGAWHGDWNHGNFRALGDTLLVWDWERFELGVPVGWDSIHLAVFGIVPRDGSPTSEALDALLADPAGLVGPLGADEGSARLVVALYLLELGTRLTQDRQAELGVPMGDISTWLLPVLERRSIELTGGVDPLLGASHADGASP